MNIYYVIKDYTEDDFSNKWKTEKVDRGMGWFLELVAEEIAENHFYEDPCSADEFECIVGVKKQSEDEPEWFIVTGQPSIIFSANKLESLI